MRVSIGSHVLVVKLDFLEVLGELNVCTNCFLSVKLIESISFRANQLLPSRQKNTDNDGGWGLVIGEGDRICNR